MKYHLYLVIFICACLQLCRSKIYAHIIVHAHADAGWVRTFESIYSNTGKKILDSVVEVMYENENYRFNWADLIFLERWWQDVDDVMKKKFRVLLERKQLQIVHPGWIMHDEATVLFQEVMDNFEVGLHFLRDTFGYTPHIAWALDTFGLSGYTPALLKKYGIDTVYLSRIGNMNRDYIEKLGYSNYIWEGHPVNGEPTQIFVCQSQFGTYSPGGLAYDVGKLGYRCKLSDLDLDPPEDCIHALYWEAMNDFVTSKVYSRGGTAKEWHFPILVGDDGAFTDAAYNFKFLDRYMERFNLYVMDIIGKDVEMIYSTMDEYLAFMKADDFEYAYHQGDWLPEIEDPGMWGEWQNNLEYWNGPFSNYPVYKSLVRQMFKRMRLSQAFFAYVAVLSFREQGILPHEGDKGKLYSNLVDAQLAGTVNLHHDAVTGTHTVNVNYDYVDKIAWAIKYSNREIDMLSNEVDEMLRNTSKQALQKVPQERLKKMNVREVKVFNPDVKAVTHHPINVTVEYEKRYFLAVDQEDNPLDLQSVPIFDFDWYNKVQYQNMTHAELFILVPRLDPFQLTHVYLFEFFNYKECLIFYGQYFQKEGKRSDSVCHPGKPNIFKASQSNPKISVQGDGKFVQVNMDPETGLISLLRYQSTEVELKQQLLAYEYWEGSETGFYLFDPNRAPIPIKELKVVKMMKQSGAIFECLHAFIERNWWLDTLKNAYFQNRICVEKKHPERMHQTFYAKSVIGYEILLRSEIVKSNNNPVNNSLEYFTHDSMFAIRRKAYTFEEGVERKILKTFDQRGKEPDGHSDSFWQANSYPCTSGLIVREAKSKVAIGFTYSRAVMCQLVDYQKWQLMLTRATQNPHFQQGIHDQQDDFDYTHFSSFFLLRTLSNDDSFDEFVDAYYRMDQEQNMGVLVWPKRLQGVPYRVDVEGFVRENEHLQMIKTTYDPHLKRIYFHLANRYPHSVAYSSMKLPGEVSHLRCSVDDTFFCGDPSYTDHPVSMAGARKGQHVTWTEYERYEIFEQNSQPFFAFVSDSEQDIVPPLSLFSARVDFPQLAAGLEQEEEEINHFDWKYRTFYKSERKFKKKVSQNVTCHTQSFLMGVLFVYYVVNMFFFYALYRYLYGDSSLSLFSSKAQKSSKPEDKKEKNGKTKSESKTKKKKQKKTDEKTT